MRVRLGPISMDYKGIARLAEVDEESHRAVFVVEGKETRGQGSASATITNRLVGEGGSTRVVVGTELSVTGRPAQFGRGIMQDVAAAMLRDFAECLSQLMMGTDAQETALAEAAAEPAEPLPEKAPPKPEASNPPPQRPQSEELKVGGVVWKVIVARVGRVLQRFARRRRPS